MTCANQICRTVLSSTSRLPQPSRTPLPATRIASTTSILTLKSAESVPSNHSSPSAAALLVAVGVCLHVAVSTLAAEVVPTAVAVLLPQRHKRGFDK
jgi:hypothetical protein